MKILLDECLPLDFRHSLPGHDAHTAAAGYHVLLTVDQGIPRRYSLLNLTLSIILIRAKRIAWKTSCLSHPQLMGQ